MPELEQDVITERGARKSAGVTNFKILYSYFHHQNYT